MNAIKENSKAAFNRQAATYDEDMKGQHAPFSLSRPVGKAVTYSVSVSSGFRMRDGRDAEAHFAGGYP